MEANKAVTARQAVSEFLSAAHFRESRAPPGQVMEEVAVAGGVIAFRCAAGIGKQFAVLLLSEKTVQPGQEYEAMLQAEIGVLDDGRHVVIYLPPPAV